MNAGFDIFCTTTTKAAATAAPLGKSGRTGSNEETSTKELNERAAFQAEIVTDASDQLIVIRLGDFGGGQIVLRIHRRFLSLRFPCESDAIFYGLRNARVAAAAAKMLLHALRNVLFRG